MAESLLETARQLDPVINDTIKVAKDSKVWLKLRSALQQKLQMFDTVRLSWWTHWAELAMYILPRRYHWLIVANQTNKGFPRNQNIVDATGTIAARTLASGLMSGLTSPTRPWFKLAIDDPELMKSAAVKMWLEEVAKRMYTVMARSNFYDALATMYFDLVVFGTAVMIIYDDYDTVIRCYNPCAGEYYLGASAALRIHEMARKFTFTISQSAEMFGVENLSDNDQAVYKAGGAQSQREQVIAHMIEPNLPITLDGSEDEEFVVPRKFRWRETYWVWGGSAERPLAMRGFTEMPFIAPRWDVVSNDPYGRSPCMDALPDIMQLQFETRRKAEAIEKIVRPPMIADVSLKNEPTSITAGGITYVANLASSGMKPVFEVRPDLKDMREDLMEIQKRIKDILFNNVLLMISQLETVRSATEVDARREEQMLQLGPVIERTQGEGLDIAMERIFGIMHRKNLFPPAPPEIQGKALQIQYKSMMAQSQLAASTAAIERTFQFAGNLAGVKPDILDNLDADDAIEKYADFLGAPASIIKDPKFVAQERNIRAKKQQQADLLNQTLAGAKGAKDLSEAQVGGGINALQMMTGGAH